MEPIQRAGRHSHGHGPREVLVSPETYKLPMHPAHSSGDQKQAREALKNAALAGSKIEAVLSSESNSLVPMLVSVKLLQQHVKL